ncbi:MFS transporter [Halorientalis pallida]|uniref:MFS transporter n=1 Tax=Halorientalis pallida TaxID=2479928 RepID=A0A498L0U6_9EURY|nr:MFS transporter [Halorientalis pallida]RXK51677.1 MFS transporter [Halorientalis pallida]
MTTRSARTALATVVFAVLLAQVLLYPGIDTLVTALGADTTLDASMWFLAAEFGAFVLFAGLWGAASDAAGRRVPFIVAGALAGAAGYALLAGLPQVLDIPFLAVLVLRTLQGAATIGAFSLSITMLMDLEGGHGRNMGAAGIAIGGGTALGAPLGGQLYEVSPFAPLVAASALLVVVGLLASRVTDRAPADDRGRFGAVRETIRETPAILVPCAFGFVDRLTAGFFALVGTLYFREVFELSPGSTGLMLALFFAPFALFQYPFGVLSDRIGRTVPVLVGSTLYGIVVIGVGLAPTVALAGAAMVAVGVIGALMAPATMALVTDLAADEQRGVAMAAFNAVGSLGFLAGVLVGGTVADQYGYVAAFLTVGGLEVAVATLAVPAFLKLGIPGIATRARES